MSGAQSSPRAIVSLTLQLRPDHLAPRQWAPKTGRKVGSGHDGKHSFWPWHCVSPVEWQGPLREAGTFPGPLVKFFHWGLTITREAPTGDQKKAEFPHRQRHNTLPTPPSALSLGIFQVTLLPSSASRARAYLRPGGGACPSPHPGSWGGGGATHQVCLGPPVGGHILDPTGAGARAARAEGSAEGLGQGGTRGSPSAGALGGSPREAGSGALLLAPGQPRWAGQLQQGRVWGDPQQQWGLAGQTAPGAAAAPAASRPGSASGGPGHGLAGRRAGKPPGSALPAAAAPSAPGTGEGTVWEEHDQRLRTDWSFPSHSESLPLVTTAREWAT